MGQLIVQKYGGTSVADPEKIMNVARRVVAVSVARPPTWWSSSPRWARPPTAWSRSPHAVTPTPDPREMDMLLATGEQVTIALLAMAIHALGHAGLLLHRRRRWG